MTRGIFNVQGKNQLVFYIEKLKVPSGGRREVLYGLSLEFCCGNWIRAPLMRLQNIVDMVGSSEAR